MSSTSSSSVVPTAKALMQQHLQQKSATRLVNSPHAKYNSRGQLQCVVCNCPVKSAIVWKAHQTKKSHIENLAKLKQQQRQLNNPLKRHAPFQLPSGPPHKKSHSTGAPPPSDFKPKGILKGIKSYESSSDSEDEADTKPAAINGVPENFFDSKLNETAEIVKTEQDDPECGPECKPDTEDKMCVDGSEEGTPALDPDDPSGYYLTQADKAKPALPPKPNTSEVLPEGFFDDPVADAKARKVDYVDKAAAEWNSFMREVSVADVHSRQIIADDTEESARRSQISQADEQMELYQRVLVFDKAQQSNQHQQPSCQSTAVISSEDSDEDDYDDLTPMNWRNKNSCI